MKRGVSKTEMEKKQLVVTIVIAIVILILGSNVNVVQARNFTVLKNVEGCNAELQGIQTEITQFELLDGETHFGFKVIGELNDHTLVVENSKDGIHFHTLALFKTERKLNHHFHVKTPSGMVDTRVYRIRKVHTEGNSCLLKTIKASLNESVMVSADVFPNPANMGEQLSINIESEEITMIKMRVINNHGDVVISEEREVKMGSNHIAVHSDKLSSGVYRVEFTEGGLTLDTRLVIH